MPRGRFTSARNRTPPPGRPFRLLKDVFEGFGIVPVFTEDTSPTGFADLIDKNTKPVWIESPTNPLLRCLDIAADE